MGSKAVACLHLGRSWGMMSGKVGESCGVRERVSLCRERHGCSHPGARSPLQARVRLAVIGIALVSTDSVHDSPSPDACGVYVLSHDPLSLPVPFSRHPARSQMKRIVAWASIQYAAHVDGATIHVTGPEERQVEFGDGTTSFATLSGGEGYINSTVSVYAPDFVTASGVSVDALALPPKVAI